MANLRRVDYDSLDLRPKSSAKTPDWHKWIDELREYNPGESFSIDPEEGESERKLKVQLTKAMESLGRGIEYHQTTDGELVARVLEQPKARPKAKAKDEGTRGTGRRGRPRANA